LEDDEEVVKEVKEEKGYVVLAKVQREKIILLKLTRKIIVPIDYVLRIHNIFTLCENQRELSQYETPIQSRQKEV
jgi:hypothetical protein